MKKIVELFAILLFVTSCTVQSPKYSTIDNVMLLQLGMTKVQVEKILGIPPFDIKSFSDTGNIYVYVYRVTDRRTLSFNTRPENGKRTKGKYVQLDVAYSKDDKVVNIESCRYCPDNLVTQSNIDFAKVSVFVTVTLPIILLFIGAKF